MNKIILSFFTFFLISNCSKKIEYPWYPYDDLNQIFNIETDKLILIDFETDWWTWCDRLDADTFGDNNVIKYAFNNLISIKVDAESGNGPEIAKRYNIRGYPTVVITNNKGTEIDRIVGYKKAPDFLKQLKRIKGGKNTIKSLLNKFQLDPRSFNTMFTLARKYEEKGDFISAKQMIDAILVENVDSSGIAEFFSYLYDARENQDYNLLLTYVDENPESPNIQTALSEAMYFVRKKGGLEKLEADIFLKLIEYDDNVSLRMLNSFSWRMSELEIKLDIALEKINYAILKVEDEKQKYMFIDTKAEILYKLKKYNLALNEIKKCIKFKPDDKYYLKQLEKIKKEI